MIQSYIAFGVNDNKKSKIARFFLSLIFTCLLSGCMNTDLRQIAYELSPDKNKQLELHQKIATELAQPSLRVNVSTKRDVEEKFGRANKAFNFDSGYSVSFYTLRTIVKDNAQKEQSKSKVKDFEWVLLFNPDGTLRKSRFSEVLN